MLRTPQLHSRVERAGHPLGRIAVAALTLTALTFASPLGVVAQLAARTTVERTSTRETFVDRGLRINAERLGVGASGRMRVRITDGERRYEAELGDGVVATLGPAATDAALASLGVVVVRTLMPSARLVLLRAAPAENGAAPDSLALAARLGSAPGAIIASAMPDLWLPHVRHFDLPPDDPRYGGQWYLDTIGIEGAWARSSGAASVTVAVVDDGCDLAHPDLAAHMLPGYDAIDDDDDPSYVAGATGNSHGTACAGLVAAVGDNAIGIAGACPECTLRCVRLLPGAGGLVPLSADVAAFDFILTSGSAVASNSWGFASGVPAPGPLVTAITTTIRDGRGGLGTVVVFAAGNDDAVIADDEVQATVGVVNVGAINQFDEAAPFSNNGPSLSLVAPTGTLTTDISGPDGDDPGDYTSSFGGTSSACPVVAGVAALLVAARPDASGADVRTTLILTVRRAPFATPDADGHDVLYGYGILDPTAALTAWLPGEADMGVILDAGADLGVTAPPSDDGCGCVAVGTGRAQRGTFLGAALLVLLALARRRARTGARISLTRAGARTALVIACTAACAAGCAATPEGAASASAELRPDTPGSTELPPRYDVGDVVETLDSTAGAFRIHYTRSGRHAVPTDDADTDGVPDYVTLVADTYDDVLVRYEELGFVPARSDALVPIDFGGSARFDVYLLDFGGMSDGSFRREICAADGGCAGYMVQENDFLGYPYPTRAYAVHLLASHEFFHAIQAAYDGARGTQSTVLAEGTAVWASERFDDSLSDVEGFASAYLDRTDRSLGTDPIGPVQAFAYGSGVFFEHLSVRYGDDAIVALWEAIPSAPVDRSWPETLDGVLTRDFASSFDAAFLDFAERVVFLGPRADDTRGLPRAAAFPGVATTTIAVPYADASLRVFPASARYFQAPASNGRFTVRTREGAAISGATVIGFALDRGAVVAEARGLGEATLEVPVSADTVLFLIADGRVSGSSRVVSVCAETGASACVAEVADAGTDVDSGTGVAGDASTTPATPMDGDGCGCRVHGAPTPRSSGPVWLVLLLGVALLRQARSSGRRAALTACVRTRGQRVRGGTPATHDS